MRTLTSILKEGLFSTHDERKSQDEIDVVLRALGLQSQDYAISGNTITIKKVIKFIEGTCENVLYALKKYGIHTFVLDKKIMSGFSIDIKNSLDFGGLKIISHTLVTIRCAKHDVVLSNLNVDIDNTHTTLVFIRTPRLINCKFSAETIKFDHALSLPVLENSKMVCTNMILDIFDNSKRFFKKIGGELYSQNHTINNKVFDIILWNSSNYIVYDYFKLQVKDQNETQRNKCHEISFVSDNYSGTLRYSSDNKIVHFNVGY